MRFLKKYGATIILYGIVVLIGLWAWNWANTPSYLRGIIISISPIRQSENIWEVEILDIEQGLNRATLSYADESFFLKLTEAHDKIEYCTLAVIGITVPRHRFYPTIQGVECRGDTQTPPATP